MNVSKKILVSDYDQTFYINDKDIEKNMTAVEAFRKQGKRLGRSQVVRHQTLTLAFRRFESSRPSQ